MQVWNMQTGQQHDLPGHQAEVLALATTAGMLFSAGKDQSIRAWQFDAASGTFRPTVRSLACLMPLHRAALGWRRNALPRRQVTDCSRLLWAAVR